MMNIKFTSAIAGVIPVKTLTGNQGGQLDSPIGQLVDADCMRQFSYPSRN